MSALLWASEILSTPLGSMGYYVLLLLAVEAILGMAFEEWRRVRRGEAQRLLAAAGGLVVIRFVYVVGGLICLTGWLDRAALLPPLERIADIASLAVLAWALLPPPSGRRQAVSANFFLGINLVAVIAAGVVFTILWGQTLAARPASDYNFEWQAAGASLWQIGLAIVAIMAVLRSRAEGWQLFLVALVIALAGRPLQLLYPGVVPQFPIWERLANLLAYPLLVVAIYQNIVVGLRQRSRQLQDISQASMDQIKSLLFLFEASREMSGSLDMSTVLDNAVQGIARALDADQCAIVFPQETDPGQMRLAAIHNPARQGRGEGVAFPLDYQLAVRQAMRRKRYLIVDEADNVQLKVLFALLGSSETGPLLIQPLVAEEEAVGAIIVGNARSQRPFTPNEAKLCQSMAEQLTGAIQNARRFKAEQTRTEELNRTVAEERRAAQQAREQVQDLTDRLAESQVTTEDLRRREEAAREARNALEIRLVSSRAESESLSDRLNLVETDLTQAHANADAQLTWQRAELARQEAAWREALQAQERLQAILNGLTAGILIADSEGRIQEANVAAEIHLDLEAGDLKGRALRTISDEPRWQQAVANAGGGEAVRLTLGVGNNTLMCDVAPLAGAGELSEGIDGIVVVMQDISAESTDRQLRLQQIAGQADELKTAIATITNYTNLILSDSNGTSSSKYLVRMRAVAERMSQTVSNLRGLADGGVLAPRLQPVDVNQVIQAAVTESQACLKDKSLAVDLDLPAGLPAVEADPEGLHQVVSHLLLNAYLASPVGARIRVQASHSDRALPDTVVLSPNGDSYVVVSIRDAGGGLPDGHEALDSVFDRSRPVRTPTGLGASGADLAMVKTLVEAQRGRVWVETESGVGTTFSFALPAEGPA